MDTSNMLLISIIFTALFLILYQFEIMRYFAIHCKNYDSYLENYKNLDAADDKHKVIISFSVDPEHIQKIKPFLKSILDQTVRVNQINLNIPSDFSHEIPKEYTDIVKVLKTEKDYKSCTNCIPTLMRAYDKDTIIIILSSDTVYGKDFISFLIKESNKDPNKAIFSTKAILIKPDFVNAKKLLSGANNFDEDWLSNNLVVEKKYVNYFNNYKSIEMFGAFSLMGALKTGPDCARNQPKVPGVN